MKKQKSVTFLYCDCCGKRIGDEDNGMDGIEPEIGSDKIYCWPCFERMEREKDQKERQ